MTIIEVAAVKCSMCKTRNMVDDGSGFRYCPYCDTSTGKVDDAGNGVARELPPRAKSYDGVGPTRGRPEGTI